MRRIHRHPVGFCAHVPENLFALEEVRFMELHFVNG